MPTPRIDFIEPLPDFRLRIGWRTGDVSVVDLSDVVNTHPAYAPLRVEPSLFDAVQVGEDAYTARWSEIMEIPCTFLWQRAQAKAA